MTDMQQNGRPWAVVTGASSGIGFELSRQCTDHGFDVLMVAEDKGIDEAARQLGAGSLRADLATHDGVERLWSSIASSGRPVDALILNAGVGNGGPFIETSLEGDLELIALNVDSVVHLSKRVLPMMVRRGSGRVLFTASIASTMPVPYYATYAASKAFVLSFAERVRKEVKSSGVTITALMPGPTDTNFFARAGMQGTKADEGPKDDPADVARDGFEAMMAGKTNVVAGSARNKVQRAMARVLPDRVNAALHGKLAEPQ